MVLLYFGLGSCVAGAVFGIPTAYLLRLVHISWRRKLYFAAVVGSIAPYALHYQHSLQYLMRSGVEDYPGLAHYKFAVPATAAFAILCSLPVAWLWPTLAALLPVVFGGLYWYFLVPLLYRDTPALFVGLDNVPFIWLFAYSVAGFVFLLLVAALSLGSRNLGGIMNSATSGAEQTVAADRREDAAPAER